MSRALASRWLCLLLALLMLAACSRLELAYRNLDRLIPWRLDDYLSLDRAQRDWLDARLDEHLRWHCRNELPRYLDWLERQRPLLAGSPSPADLEAPLGESRSLLQPTLARIAPDATRLLAGLSATQVDELEENLLRERNRLHARYLGRAPAERLQRRVERAQRRLEDWLGPLHPQQRAYLRQWALRQDANVAPWLANRAHWQTLLLAQLRAAPRDNLATRLEPLLSSPERYWEADYQRAVSDGQQALAELLSELWASSTRAQRQHLDRRLDSLRGDLAGLPCRD